MKYVLGILTIGLLCSFFFIKATPDDQVTAKFTYTTIRCDYDVYTAQAGGHIGCNDWGFYKTLRPGGTATITLSPGDGVVVRIVESGANVCDGARQKKQASLSFRSDATRSSSHNEELHDWSCD